MKNQIKQFSLLVLFVLIMIVPAVQALTYPQLDADAQKGEIVRETKQETPQSFLDRAIDPEHYIIGPGDVFLIQFYKSVVDPFEIVVLPEGAVAIPSVGLIHLGQINLNKAKEIIASEIRSRFKDSRLAVSLGRLRSFKIAVTGAVEKPGMVVVSASDRVSEAIELAGGLQYSGSRRNILLIEDSGDTVIADIDYFNAGGSMDLNPYLHEGQVVFVPVVSSKYNKVEIYGAINSSGIFEFREGDRISDLLKLGFGIAVNADLNNVELVRISESAEQVININLIEIINDESSPLNLKLQSDDRLFIREIPNYHNKQEVTIIGEVRFPGVYPIRDGCQTVAELVKKAGGILKTASLVEAEMMRSGINKQSEQTNLDRLLNLSTDKLSEFELQYLKATSATNLGKVSLDFRALLERNDNKHDVLLHDQDIIVIPTKSYAISILGRVVNPGLVPFRENQSIDYYIRLAGGFGDKVDKKKIRIIKANSGSIVKPGGKTTIEMGDRIMVPQTKGTDWWKLIKDTGFFLANIATIYVVVDQAIK